MNSLDNIQYKRDVYQNLLEKYQRLYPGITMSEEIVSFITMLIGTKEEPLTRTFTNLHGFRTVLMDIWIKKEDEFIANTQVGQVLETINMGKRDIGVVQRIIGRTIYLTGSTGETYHSTADRVITRIM
tara:strand:- start:1256 stop:1639 length:384 start_codon:yes stop_codon:yes gene_type:complete